MVILFNCVSNFSEIRNWIITGLEMGQRVNYCVINKRECNINKGVLYKKNTRNSGFYIALDITDYLHPHPHTQHSFLTNQPTNTRHQQPPVRPRESLPHNVTQTGCALSQSHTVDLTLPAHLHARTSTTANFLVEDCHVNQLYLLVLHEQHRSYETR